MSLAERMKKNEAYLKNLQALQEAARLRISAADKNLGRSVSVSVLKDCPANADSLTDTGTDIDTSENGAVREEETLKPRKTSATTSSAPSQVGPRIVRERQVPVVKRPAKSSPSQSAAKGLLPSTKSAVDIRLPPPTATKKPQVPRAPRSTTSLKTSQTSTKSNMALRSSSKVNLQSPPDSPPNPDKTFVIPRNFSTKSAVDIRPSQAATTKKPPVPRAPRSTGSLKTSQTTTTLNSVLPSSSKAKPQSSPDSPPNLEKTFVISPKTSPDERRKIVRPTVDAPAKVTTKAAESTRSQELQLPDEVKKSKGRPQIKKLFSRFKRKEKPVPETRNKTTKEPSRPSRTRTQRAWKC